MKKKIIILITFVVLLSSAAFATNYFYGFHTKQIPVPPAGGTPSCGSPVLVNDADYITTGPGADYVCVD